jgi:hypothetical protein
VEPGAFAGRTSRTHHVATVSGHAVASWSFAIPRARQLTAGS